MSPDLEWRVGDETGQETIAATSPRPMPRWRKGAIAIAMMLGVSLGVIYASIPGPPKPIAAPTSAPTKLQPPVPTFTPTDPPRPTPTIVPLREAIRRDADRLAMGAGDPIGAMTFAPTRDVPAQYIDWYAMQQNAYGQWGTVAPAQLYQVIQTGTLPSGVVWVDLQQARSNDTFRHTRFYQQRSGRWAWTLPDSSFWSGAYASATTDPVRPLYPFTVTYPIEDRAVMSVVLERFIHVYADLCGRLNCPHSTGSFKLSVIMLPGMWQSHTVDAQGDQVTVTMPSPRVIGYYENPDMPGDPIASIAYDTLIDQATRVATGDYVRWLTRHGGELFLQAIAARERRLIQDTLHPPDLFFAAPSLFRPPDQTARDVFVRLFADQALVPLITLWDWPRTGPTFGQLQDTAIAEADAVITFMAERYGSEGVIKFLNALGPARSLDEAIGRGLGVKFGEFSQQWLTWIGKQK
jgi:hypothetical protein